jgi:hypothetical protein
MIDSTNGVKQYATPNFLTRFRTKYKWGHALTGAVLAAGFYLMQPPWVAYNTFDADAPISKWSQAISLDSAEQCEQIRTGEISYYLAHPHAKQADWYLRLNAASLCIATDDPRLKD